MKWSLALGADPWGRGVVEVRRVFKEITRRSKPPDGGSAIERQVMPPAAGGIPPDPPIFFNHGKRNARNPTFASETGGAVSRRVCS